MNRQVVVRVKIERLRDAIVAAQTKLRAMTVFTVGWVIDSDASMIATESQVMCISAQHAAGRQRATRQVGLDPSFGVADMARRAA